MSARNAGIDPYAVLGVTRAATPAEITHAFRAKLRALHPDTRYAGAPAGAETQLRQVLAANQQLRHSGHHTDAGHTANPSAAPPPPPPKAGPAPPPRRMSPNPQEPVKIPITYHRTPFPIPGEGLPLWAGPVRWHRGS